MRGGCSARTALAVATAVPDAGVVRLVVATSCGTATIAAREAMARIGIFWVPIEWTEIASWTGDVAVWLRSGDNSFSAPAQRKKGRPRLSRRTKRRTGQHATRVA